MLALILSGAVLACGGLFVLSGAAKLYRAARRTDVSGSAIRESLRISPRRWRWVETAAGVVEAATGVAVCVAFDPVVAGAALATQGAIFSVLLAYARRAKASGGCSCIRSSKDPDKLVAWPVQARAAWLLVAGVVEALVRLPRPAVGTGDGLIIGFVGLSTLLLMLAAEASWQSPRCNLPIPLRPRNTARVLMRHGVYAAMADAVGPFVEDFSYHREGCVEVFQFAATARPGRADRTVAFRVSRPARGALAVEARIEAAVG
jgi:hypothetical protein